MTITVVTPYCGEDRETLARCIASVASQTVPCRHLMVADGKPDDWVDSQPVRHLRLDAPHRDFGNVARGVGALLAAGEGADAIAFLDADNAYDPDHIATCLAVAAATPGCDYVVARRRFVTPGGEPLAVDDDPDMLDTNCLLLLPGAYPAIAHWALMPRELSVIGDRIVHAALRGRGLIEARTAKATVTYTSLWAGNYEQCGMPVPDGAKRLDIAGLAAWIEALSPQQKAVAERLAGATLNVDRK